MTGGLPTPSGRPPASASTYDLWAYHERIGHWLLIVPGLRGQAANDELITRQDRVRRSGQPCTFRLLPTGQRPA